MKKIIAVCLVLSGLGTAIFAEKNGKSAVQEFREQVPAITEGAGVAVKDLIDGIGTSVESAAKTIENYKIDKITGKLKVCGKGEDMVLTLKCAGWENYTIKTPSQTQSSRDKLAVFKNRRLTMSGVLNREKKEFTVVSFELAE